ncbi:MAG TPA: hypothetical protein VGX03_17965 [Candidatus Binatia bacterium]|nr:hypothetical protein [Candidatus Binatia bacterium]
MSLEEEFDRRIAVIHGFGDPHASGYTTGESPMDIRHAEFQAMADVFLGEDFNQTKLRQVEDLQIALHARQAELYRLYETKAIRPEDYVQSFNVLLEETFRKCEEILGQEDFLKLFGAPRSQLAGFIDKETFLNAH